MQTPEEFGVTLDKDLQALWNTNEALAEDEIQNLVKHNDAWSDFLDRLVEDQLEIINLQRKRNAWGIVKRALIVVGILVGIGALLSIFLR